MKRALVFIAATVLSLPVIAQLGAVGFDTPPSGGGSGFVDGGVKGTGTTNSVAWFSNATTIKGTPQILFDSDGADGGKLLMGVPTHSYNMRVDQSTNLNNSDQRAGYGVSVFNSTGSTLGPDIRLWKGYGTEASPAAVQSDSQLGRIRFLGQYSTTQGQGNDGAQIVATPKATFSGSECGTELDIKTCTTGASSTASRITVAAATGNVSIANALNVGGAATVNSAGSTDIVLDETGLTRIGDLITMKTASGKCWIFATSTHQLLLTDCVGGNAASTITALGLTLNTTNGTTIGISTTTPLYKSSTNCADPAGAAACTAAPSGAFVIDVGASAVTVSTTAVTSTSRIKITRDESLGTELGITCNTTAAGRARNYVVTARVAGTSFTVTGFDTAGNAQNVATNVDCLTYDIMN